ncbi:hypothetical protein AAC387_Pa08g1469 [Persea americana]
MVSGINSLLRGEGAIFESATTAVPSSEAVTVAIPTGRLVESGHPATTLPDREPTRTSAAEPQPSRRKRLVASSSSESSTSSSSEEEEEERETLRRRGQHYIAEDLSAAAFGDIGGEAQDPPQAVAATLSAAAGGTSIAPVAETVRATATEATQSTVIKVASALPSVTIVVDDSPPDHAIRAGGPAHSAEVAKGGRPEKRARVETSPGPSSPPPAGGTISPPPLAPWRPAIEEVLGKQLAETDRVADPQVVATLGRASAFPQDMARWAEMGNESLLLSSMRSLVTLLQKCQVGIERLDTAEAREAEWVAEREELQASLAAREAMLVEEVGKNAGLVSDLEESQVLVEHLREELKDEGTQNLHLASELDDLRTEVVQLEEDLRDARRTNKRLLSQRNLVQGSLEMALRGKAAEIESALERQEARLKEEFLAEHNSIMGEEVGKLTADYKAQLPGIQDRAWELGWKAALKKAGVPLLRNPPKFPPSDSELLAISLASPCLPPQACPEASAAPEAPSEAPPTASTYLEDSPAPAIVHAPSEAVVPESSVPEASAVVFEATSTVPEVSAVMAEAAPEIDCNVKTAAP